MTIDYTFKNHLPPQPKGTVPEDSIEIHNICKYLKFGPSKISRKINILDSRKKPEGMEHSYRPAALTDPRSVRLGGGMANLRALSKITVLASDIYNIGKDSE